MSPSRSSRPTTDSTSDNDTSEKPVREKLKKTSLASMSNYIVGKQERALKANEEKPAPDHIDRDSSWEKNIDKKALETRGRPLKKRSYDDLDTPEVESPEAGVEPGAKPNANGHLRKRSRDVRVGEIPTENRRPLLAGTPVREESEDAENSFETSDTCINRPKSAADTISPTTETLSQVEMEHDQQFQDINEPTKSITGTVEGDPVRKSDKGSADHEMRDSACSPQKKRSRDQFDTEADREQKIPATEEARAHRRSDELERGEVSALRNRSPVSPKGSEAIGIEPVAVAEEKGLEALSWVERQQVGFIARPRRIPKY